MARPLSKIIFSSPEEKREPLNQSLITQIKDFFVEINKFIDEQKLLTPDEVTKMKREVTVASEELEIACERIAEKFKHLE